MKKRLTFKCGKCKRIFSFTKELTDEQELFFTCPFCGQELVLRLAPFQTRKITVLRGEGQAAQETTEWEYAFLDVIDAELRE